MEWDERRRRKIDEKKSHWEGERRLPNTNVCVRLYEYVRVWCVRRTGDREGIGYILEDDSKFTLGRSCILKSRVFELKWKVKSLSLVGSKNY